jgi:hypothetical protein
VVFHSVDSCKRLDSDGAKPRSLNREPV